MIKKCGEANGSYTLNGELVQNIDRDAPRMPFEWKKAA